MTPAPVEDARIEPALCPKTNGFLDRFQDFLSSYRFAAFTIGFLIAIEVWMAGLTLLPASSEGLGAFAEQFRVWCLGKDPRSGDMEWAYIVTMLVQPPLFALMIAILWWRPLRVQFERRAVAIVPYGVASVALAAAALLVLITVSEPAPAQPLAFPARALRTAHVPPPVVLVNQDGARVDLADLEGSVVLMTGIYASCGQTCPLMMAQAKRALSKLSRADQREVRFLAITLNPEHDDVQVLKKLQLHHGLTAPYYNFLTGPPDQVHATLDRLQIARKKDEKTGIIDHTSLFFLIDRNGLIAYRFALGPEQEPWMVEALELLVRERRKGA